MKAKQLTPLAVAVPFVALSLAGGGFSLELRSALTVVLWAIVLAGLATGVLPRAPAPRPALVAGALLAGLALLTGISMAWASDDGAAFGELVRVLGYLGLFVGVLCVSPPGSARAWLVGLALGAVAVAALALGSRLIPALPGDDHQLASFLPAAAGRLSYPIGYWNALGAVMALGVTLTAWLGAEARGALWRALATSAIPALGLAIYLASSRGAVAAAIAGFAVLFALSERRTRLLAGFVLGAAGTGALVLFASGQSELVDGLSGGDAESQGRQVLLALALVTGAVGLGRWMLDGWLEGIAVSARAGRIALAAAAVVAVAALLAANPSQRWDDFKAPPDEGRQLGPGYVADHFASSSGSGRYQYWSEAIDAFDEEPLHGIGAGAYASYWNRHAPISQTTHDAHSLFAETLGELGPLGLILIVGFLAMGPIALRARRLPARAPEVVATLGVLAAVATTAAIDIAWEIPLVFTPAVVAVALLAGPAIRSEVEPETAAGSRFGWGLATLAVGWIALIAAANSFLTEQSIDASREAVRDSDHAAATSDADDAVALQPWSAEPRLQLALVRESAGDLQGAEQAIDEAIARAEDDWLLWLAKARIETRAGRVEQAREALAQARKLNPRAPILQAVTP